MELAIQLFSVNDSPDKTKLEKLISKEKGINAEWHATDVCRRLIEKPLHLDSKQHAFFWSNLRAGLSLGRVRATQLACVVVDDLETMLVTHYDVLVSMLEVLLDNDFYSQLESLRELPLNILKILVSKQGLRRFVFKNLSESCRGEIDTEDLRRKSELGFELYINTVDDLFEFREFESNDTPSPSIEGRYERPSKRSKQPDEWYEAKEFLEFFPVRRGRDQHSRIIPFDADSIATMLSAYSMLWTDLNQLRTAAVYKAADMKSAFPMMLAFMAEDLDRQTLGRSRGYFAGDQDILETVQISAQRLRAYLIGGDIIDPRFAEGRSVYHNRAQPLYDLHCSRLNRDQVNPGSLYNTKEWSLQHVSVVPVIHFLNQLDYAVMIAGRSLRVRDFLHQKDRLEYFAYRFPEGISLFAVESSLEAMCNWWDIPMLKDSYVVVPTHDDRVAIVTTPSVMLCMRMISITRAFVAGIVEPISFWRFCVRNLVHLPPKTCPELHNVALFCTMAAVGYKLVSGHVFKSMATPDNPLFEVYRFLPAFCRCSKRMKSSSYEDLCNYVRLLLQAPSSQRLSLAFGTLYLILDIIQEQPEESEYADLTKKITSRITRSERYKQKNHARVVLTPLRPQRCNKKGLYLHDILRVAMENQEDRVDRIEYLFKDLLSGAKLTRSRKHTPKTHVDRGIGQHRIESFAKLEKRVRREERDFASEESLIDSDLLTLAYNYYTSRGFFVPTLHHKTIIDKVTAEPDTTPTIDHKTLPPQECTADNVREHIEHYYSANFIEFLYRCFTDTEESSGVSLSQIQTILTSEEPPLLEVRLSNGDEALIDECFLLSRANIKAKKKKRPEFADSNTCNIDDQLAQDLVTQYGQSLVVGDQVTRKMDYGKSYLECVQHLHEILED